MLSGPGAVTFTSSWWRGEMVTAGEKTPARLTFAGAFPMLVTGRVADGLAVGEMEAGSDGDPSMKRPLDPPPPDPELPPPDPPLLVTLAD